MTSQNPPTAAEPQPKSFNRKPEASASVHANAFPSVSAVRRARLRLAVKREAESLEDAIRSAIADVQKAGCTVTEVTLEADALAALPQRT